MAVCLQVASSQSEQYAYKPLTVTTCDIKTSRSDPGILKGGRITLCKAQNLLSFKWPGISVKAPQH